MQHVDVVTDTLDRSADDDERRDARTESSADLISAAVRSQCAALCAHDADELN